MGLNEVFCYIVSKLGDFQNLRHYVPRSKEEVETLVTSAFPPFCPRFSKRISWICVVSTTRDFV